MPTLIYSGWAGFDRFVADGQIRGKTVIDIGANEGGFVETFLQHGAEKVVAVEPSPEFCDKMRQRFGETDRVIICQNGISDRPEHLSDVSFLNCWTLGKPGQYPLEHVKAFSSFDVELVTLDDLTEKLGLKQVAFLKVDTDGYELRVLRGGKNLFRELRPPAMIELSYLPERIGDSNAELVDTIYAFDYVICTMDLRVATAKQVMDYGPWSTSCDVMMLPKEITSGFSTL